MNDPYQGFHYQNDERAIVPATSGGVMPPDVVRYHQQMTRIEKVKYGVVAGVPIGLALEVLGAGGFGIFGGVVVGAMAGFWSEEVRDIKNAVFPRHNRPTVPEKKRKIDKMHFLLTGQIRHADQQQDEDVIEAAPANEEAELFQVDASADTGGVQRLTIEQIVRNCQPNSFKIFIGRSMTKTGNKAVLINFYKQHFRFIGASQRGKSSMLAAFLAIVTRTHDPRHVRLILLDKEDKTSWLFAHLPHVLSMKRSDGTNRKLHARNEDEVLEFLIHSIVIMKHRNTMPTTKILELPIILIYIEEFLAVKNEFRSRIDRVRGEEAKEKAASDYATFMHCIGLLAQQGLKFRMQLLLCAQVEYADDDFREAMASIGCGFSFCVRPKAAASAGFMNTELLNRNAKDNKIGQAVVETPDCNDLVLAPDFDLEKRLLEFEKAHPEIHQIAGDDINADFETVNDSTVNNVEPLDKPVNAVERSTDVHQDYTKIEIQILMAYHSLSLSGEKVTRTALRDYLGWNSKQYTSILKPICDKLGILMES